MRKAKQTALALVIYVIPLIAVAVEEFEVAGSFVVKNPAYFDVDDRGDLWISSFGRDIQGTIWRIENFRAGNFSGNYSVKRASQALNWPNRGVVTSLNNQRVRIVPNGFFSPPFSSINRGSVGILAIDEENMPLISNMGDRGKRWFYHQVILKDWNGDGRLDIITARSNWSPLPFSGNPRGELVVFYNSGKNTGPWREEIIVKGPSVYFQLADLDGDGVEEIIAPQVFQERLVVYKRKGSEWQSYKDAYHSYNLHE